MGPGRAVVGVAGEPGRERPNRVGRPYAHVMPRVAEEQPPWAEAEALVAAGGEVFPGREGLDVASWRAAR
jgi:hypothetical protein